MPTITQRSELLLLCLLFILLLVLLCLPLHLVLVAAGCRVFEGRLHSNGEWPMLRHCISHLQCFTHKLYAARAHSRAEFATGCSRKLSLCVEELTIVQGDLTTTCDDPCLPNRVEAVEARLLQGLPELRLENGFAVGGVLAGHSRDRRGCPRASDGGVRQHPLATAAIEIALRLEAALQNGVPMNGRARHGWQGGINERWSAKSSEAAT
mmetsp:Transcript_79903/g.202105  ORF Transcript_79903/g.202105 Transcript_79903/m.202105 type:complete len:209 (+) Transcript_79903:327-953(+)